MSLSAIPGSANVWRGSGQGPESGAVCAAAAAAAESAASGSSAPGGPGAPRGTEDHVFSIPFFLLPTRWALCFDGSRQGRWGGRAHSGTLRSGWQPGHAPASCPHLASALLCGLLRAFGSRGGTVGGFLARSVHESLHTSPAEPLL